MFEAQFVFVGLALSLYFLRANLLMEISVKVPGAHLKPRHRPLNSCKGMLVKHGLSSMSLVSVYRNPHEDWLVNVSYLVFNFGDHKSKSYHMCI